MDSEVGEADLALDDGGEVRAAGVTEGSDEDRNEPPESSVSGAFWPFCTLFPRFIITKVDIIRLNPRCSRLPLLVLVRPLSVARLAFVHSSRIFSPPSWLSTV